MKTKRSDLEIVEIKKTLQKPYSIDHFINADEICHLIKIFQTADDTNSFYSNKIYKNTGPITLDLKDYYDDEIVKSILERIQSIIGNFEITAAFFFYTDYPHVIHNDDTHELPSTVYKGINIPLKLYAENIIEYPKLCFFNQLYFNGPSKFFFADSNIPTYYNKQVYEYSKVANISSTPISDDIIDTYFTHLKKQWLTGLSVDCMEDWIPGRAIIFDSVQLHCASDFRKLNINAKLGISIFTKKC